MGVDVTVNSRTGDRPVGGEDGAAAVEFAILLPLLVALLFGLIQFGIAFSNKIQATNAAREGARMAAVGISNWGDVNGVGKSFWQIVREEAGGIAISNCSLTTSNTIGDALTVEFDYPADLNIPFVPSSVTTGHVAATMPIEQTSAGTPGPC